jgi:hypothetical protein
MCTFTDFPLWLFICHLMLPYGLMEGYFFQARSQAKGTEKSTRGTKPRSLKTRGHASLPVCTNTECKFWHIICKKNNQLEAKFHLPRLKGGRHSFVQVARSICYCVCKIQCRDADESRSWTSLSMSQLGNQCGLPTSAVGSRSGKCQIDDSCRRDHALHVCMLGD